jgi:hypothetical protein
VLFGPALRFLVAGVKVMSTAKLPTANTPASAASADTADTAAAASTASSSTSGAVRRLRAAVVCFCGLLLRGCCCVAILDWVTGTGTLVLTKVAQMTVPSVMTADVSNLVHKSLISTAGCVFSCCCKDTCCPGRIETAAAAPGFAVPTQVHLMLRRCVIEQFRYV